MNSTTKIACIALCTLLAGCSAATNLILALDGPRAKKIEALEKREAELLKKYEKRVEKVKRNIQSYKKKINDNIKRQKVGEAFSNIKALHRQTHPCDTRRCTEKDNRSSYGVEQILESENIDREMKFISASLDKVYKVSQSLANAGRYDQLTASYSRTSVRWSVSFDKKRLSKFEAFEKKLNARWMALLVKQAQQVESSYPAIALLKWNKAAELAAKVKQGDKQRSYAKRVASLRQRILNEYRLNIYVQSTTGPLAGPVITQLRKQSMPNIQLTQRRDNGTRAILSMRSAAPSYKISSSRQTGSFRYTKGTAKKPNPKIRELQRKLKISTTNQARCRRTCGKPYKSCRVDKWNGGYRDVTDDAQECKEIQIAQGEINKLNAQLASTPKNLEQTVYAQRSYPYTLHAHTASASVSYSLSFTSRLSPVNRTKTFSGQLTDREHGAHQYKDGSVPASGKQLPSQSSVRAELVTSVRKALQAQLLASYKDYLNFLPKMGDTRSEEGKRQRLNGLIIYNIMSGGKIPARAERSIESLSGIPGAKRFAR